MEQRNDHLDEFMPGSNIEGGDDRPVFQDEQINDEDLPAIMIDDYYEACTEPDLNSYFIGADGRLQLSESQLPNIHNIL